MKERKFIQVERERIHIHRKAKSQREEVREETERVKNMNNLGD